MSSDLIQGLWIELSYLTVETGSVTRRNLKLVAEAWEIYCGKCLGVFQIFTCAEHSLTRNNCKRVELART